MPSQYIVSELVARESLEALKIRLRWHLKRGRHVNGVPANTLLAFRQLAERLGLDPIKLINELTAT